MKPLVSPTSSAKCWVPTTKPVTLELLSKLSNKSKHSGKNTNCSRLLEPPNTYVVIHPKVIQTPKKRLGRGFGSGVGGHTVGRGQKGQKTRGIIPLWFEGGQLPLVRRTPFIKGKHRFQVIKLQPITVNFDRFRTSLRPIPPSTLYSLATALKVSEKEAKRGFKIIATGKLTKPFQVAVSASAGAIKAIEAAGGKIVSSK